MYLYLYFLESLYLALFDLFRYIRLDIISGNYTLFFET